MTKKQLRKVRRQRDRERRRSESYTKPQPFSRADEFRFGVLGKR